MNNIFRLATWNVNSVRSRHDHLIQWLTLRKFPEIVCLQETKVVNDDFPRQELESLGYQVTLNGQKSYNGVAILSRFEMKDVQIGMGNPAVDKEARVISATIEGVRIVNVYVPNGQMPQSEKYIWKFEFLKAFIKYLQQAIKDFEKVIVCGDLNIAFEPIDVWAPDAFKGSIMFTDQERKVLGDIFKLGLKDSFRILNPEAHEFSWFDYMSMAFQANRGWRIDYILATKSALDLIEACKIDPEPRGWEKPSDHCPVVIKVIESLKN